MTDNPESGDVKSNEERKKEASLDEQTVSYFKRLKDFLRDDEIDDESRTLFIANVFIEIEGKEILLSKDQGLSRIMEDLLKHLTTIQLCKIMNNIASKDGFYSMCTDKFASHVIQTLVDLIPDHLNSETGKGAETKKEAKLPKLEKLFLSFCEVVIEHLTEFITHMYASHVLRSIFQTLSGSKVLESVIRSRSSRCSRKKDNERTAPGKQKVKRVGAVVNSNNSDGQNSFCSTMPVPSTFIPVLQRITTEILNLKQFENLSYHPVGNPVLQTLLLVLSVSDTKFCGKVCKAIMKQTRMFEVEEEKEIKEGNEDENMNQKETVKEQRSRSEKKIPRLFSHDIGSHLVEKVLQVAKPKLHKKLFSECFKGRLVTLASHPISNYIVQHLLATLSTQDQAELVIDELEDYIEDMLAVGHMGVVVRMVELCARFKVKQKFFINSLLKVFHCQFPKERQISLVQLLGSLTTYDVFFCLNEDSQEKQQENQSSHQIKDINYHGAMILKTLLMFEENKLVVKSFVNLSVEELVTMACDQHGSFVVEAFFKSENISQKKKTKIIRYLKGNFHKLACNRFGSHVIDTCWSHIDIDIKDEIADDLSHHDAELSKDFYGRFVLRNCGIEHYKLKKGTWKEKEAQIVKKKQLFADILGEDVVQDIKPKKRKKVKSAGEDEIVKQQKNTESVWYQRGLEELGFGDQCTNQAETDFNKLAKPSPSPKDDEIDILFSGISRQKKNKGDSELSEGKTKQFDVKKSLGKGKYDGTRKKKRK